MMGHKKPPFNLVKRRFYIELVISSKQDLKKLKLTS